MKKFLISMALVLVVFTACYPVMPQADVDARRTLQAEVVLPTVTLAAAEIEATEVIIEATMEATPVPECLIKGNVNSRKEKIYHVPGGASYDRTIVDPEHGEAWYCSEEEAVAAGFRKALR
jgi:hypothetical protein